MTSQKDIAVKVEHLTKSFRIPLEHSNGIKQKIINTLKGRKGYREFTPLRDISFEIEKGEFFGIVGRNGSGKSTLLKSIAGIYTIEDGKVHVDGKLVPFIELGVGFNAELTGRENVFLNGALLGFSNDEVREMYDEIVDFAELHDFMEERLKNYSSGMQVRLAFSIAIRAKGDILLLDEVLAVGDEAFQRKCYAYFDDLRRHRKTVILVTHDMRAIEKYCDRAILLSNGEVFAIGSSYEISKQYSKLNEPKPDDNKEEQADSDKAAALDKGVTAKILDAKTSEPKRLFGSREDVKVSVSWTNEEIKNVGVAIVRRDGEYIFGTNTYIEKFDIGETTQADFVFNANLYEGDYFVKVGFFGENDNEKINFIEEGPLFTVTRDYEGAGWGGITKLPHHWES